MRFNSVLLDHKAFITIIICILTILSCTLPMKLNPIWNGENPGHRNQYELTAQSLLHGNVKLDLSVDEKLLELENPYDPDERKAANVQFHWDHAFYKGNYYMYFGVVPAVVVFLPYLAITGHSLASYHATQLFVALFIIGLFSLFWNLYRTLFREIPFANFLLLASSFSIMSVWYSIGSPALYCTAITSGLCFGIWSLFFFVRALESIASHQSHRYRVYLIAGSLLGALVFGCRPPIGLVNMIVIPVIFRLFKNRQSSKGIFFDTACVLFPYAIIGIALMTYNFIRFESLFEFGQSYQLTVADQQNYSENNDNWLYLPIRFFQFFFATEGTDSSCFNGALFNFPILLFSACGLASKRAREALVQSKSIPFLITVVVVIVIIAIIDSLWSPEILERYRMDVYWLCSFVSFVLLSSWSCAIRRNALNIAIGIFAVSTLWLSLLYIFTPFDYNLGVLFPDISKNIRNALSFGILKPS